MNNQAENIANNLKNILQEMNDQLRLKKHDWTKIKSLDENWQAELKNNLNGLANKAIVEKNVNIFQPIIQSIQDKHLALMRVIEIERLKLRDSALSQSKNTKSINKYIENSR